MRTHTILIIMAVCFAVPAATGELAKHSTGMGGLLRQATGGTAGEGQRHDRQTRQADPTALSGSTRPSPATDRGRGQDAASVGVARGCPGFPELSLVAEDACVGAGEQLVVTVELGGLTEACPDILGGQFLLAYDNAVLDFVGAEVGGGLIVEEIYAAVDEAAGTIDYAVGTSQTAPLPGIVGGPMAVLTFDVLAESCAPLTGLVVFRTDPGVPPTRLVDEFGLYYDAGLGNLELNDLGEIVIDRTPPAIVCPPDLDLAGQPECDDTDPGLALATDGCDASPVIYFDRDDDGYGFLPVAGNEAILNAPFCVADSPITIAWYAEDACGNVSAPCEQTVTVSGATLDAVVQLAGNFAGRTFARCISFTLYDCDEGGVPLTVEQVVTFTDGLGVATVPLAAAAVTYDCITASDPLHTLARTDNDDFAYDPVSRVYTADFTDKSGVGGDDDSLIGGNTNADAYIDIVDFGFWVMNYGLVPGADTDCATAGPHPDFSGDGLVDELDFAFIQINFLAAAEAGCCLPLLGPGGDAGGPITSLAVDELPALGLGALAVLDLNHDGVYDLTDVRLWLGGARPGRKPAFGGPVEPVRRGDER